MKNYGYLDTRTAVMMVAVALFFDAVQALLLLIVVGAVADTLVACVALPTFLFWCRLHGVHFVSSKRIVTMGGATILEVIPVLNILPAWTLAIVLIYLTAKLPKPAQAITNPKAATSLANDDAKTDEAATEPLAKIGPAVSKSADGIRKAA